MIRPVLALERLSFLEQEGKIGYRHGEVDIISMAFFADGVRG